MFKNDSRHNLGGPICPLDEHEILLIDNEKDIHMSFKNYEESSYGLDLNLLTILY